MKEKHSARFVYGMLFFMAVACIVAGLNADSNNFVTRSDQTYFIIGSIIAVIAITIMLITEKKKQE